MVDPNSPATKTSSGGTSSNTTTAIDAAHTVPVPEKKKEHRPNTRSVTKYALRKAEKRQAYLQRQQAIAPKNRLIRIFVVITFSFLVRNLRYQYPFFENYVLFIWNPPGSFRYYKYHDGTNLFLPASPTDYVLKQSNVRARFRRAKIRKAMQHAWSGYKEYAWGYDELTPMTRKGQNNWGGMATTMVDSLDTLWLMGLKKDFWDARDWIAKELHFESVEGFVSTFETTIRNLGGLLAAYDWSGDQVFLAKANELGGRLLHAFDSPSGLPYASIDLQTNSTYDRGYLLLAEVGTLQVEFRYLAKVTGNKEYAEKAEKVFNILKSICPNKNGLYPSKLTFSHGEPKWSKTDITMGGKADSFYEYMLKLWLQGGKQEPMYREMYDTAMQGVHDSLLSKSKVLTYLVNKDGVKKRKRMDHLACFLPGTLALGAFTHPDGLESFVAQRDLKTSKALAYTCYQM